MWKRTSLSAAGKARVSALEAMTTLVLLGDGGGGDDSLDRVQTRSRCSPLDVSALRASTNERWGHAHGQAGSDTYSSLYSTTTSRLVLARALYGNWPFSYATAPIVYGLCTIMDESCRH